jgi:hypothetical protein
LQKTDFGETKFGLFMAKFHVSRSERTLFFGQFLGGKTAFGNFIQGNLI